MPSSALLCNVLMFVSLASTPTLLWAKPSEGPKVVRIGVVVDGPGPQNAEVLGLYQREILELTKDEFDVRFPEDKQRVADWSFEAVASAVTVLLADPEVDMILAAGLIASNDVGQRATLPKPVLAPYVIDAEVQGLPLQNGVSGRANLSYVSFPNVFSNDLRSLVELTGAKRVASLITTGFKEAVPQLIERSRKIAETMGVELVRVEVAESADDALSHFPDDVDAVFVGPLIRLSELELKRLSQGIIAKRLPSFSMMGRKSVEEGLLAANSVGLDHKRIARRVALNVQRILLGEKPESLRVMISREERLVINMATARVIGFWPTWQTLTEADLIHPTRATAERKMTLRSATDDALAANVDLLANERGIIAGVEEIAKARSGLFPHVELSALGTMIDRDRADASFGNQAERQLSASATVRQVIYSAPVYANLSVQKYLQSSRTFQREQLRLDVVLETASAYLNILRAKAFDKIQRDNLAATRSHLELAQLRRTIGAATRSEVLRWEARIAQERFAVISASSRRNAAEIALNRLLSRPLEEPFLTEDSEAGVDTLETCNLFENLDNPWAFRIFRSLMVEEGLGASPELHALDELIEAREETLSLARRAFWAPTFFLQGSLGHILAKGGAGAGGAAQPPPGLESLIKSTDDTTWSVSVGASLPIFMGTERIAELNKAELELSRQVLEREALAQRIEQRIRTILHAAGASLANIRLSRDSAEAARKNLEIVRDAYGRGVLSYLDLIDAQNASLVAEEVAAGSVYDFMLDFVAAQRAVARFSFLETKSANCARTERLKERLRDAGHTPAPAPGQ